MVSDLQLVQHVALVKTDVDDVGEPGGERSAGTVTTGNPSVVTVGAAFASAGTGAR